MNIGHKHWTIADGCLADPELIPRATPYASTIASDVPIVVQHPGLGPRSLVENE